MMPSGSLFPNGPSHPAEKIRVATRRLATLPPDSPPEKTKEVLAELMAAVNEARQPRPTTAQPAAPVTAAIGG